MAAKVMLPARWYLLLAIVGAWLAIIAHELPHFYGDFGDDYYTCFRIGYETVQAWQTAFTKWHVNAPYYFLISYLPIKLHFAIPGVAIPNFQPEQIALYRGLIAYTIFLHAVILVLYALFVYRVTNRMLSTLLALLLMLSSPVFLAWATTTESRIIGLLFALPGMTILAGLRYSTAGSRRSLLLQTFTAGCLLTTSYLVHYTALYLIVPFAIAYWLVTLFHRGLSTKMLQAVGGFIIGLAAPQAIVEIVGQTALHIPNTLTNFTVLAQANAQLYGSQLTYAQKAHEWFTAYAGDDGWPLIVVSLAAIACLVPNGRHHSAFVNPSMRLVLLLALLMGVSGSFYVKFVPYRTQAILQPVLFLLAAVGVTVAFDAILARCWKWFSCHPAGRPRLGRVLGYAIPNALLCFLWLLVLWLPASVSTSQVLARRVNLGRLLERVPRPSVMAAPVGNVVDQAVFDRTGVGIGPAQLLDMEPNVYAFDCLHPNCTYLPNRERLIHVVSVDADSSLENAAGIHDPTRVLDGGISHDGITDWISGDGSGDHWVELHFDQPYDLDQMVIANRRQSIRADTIDIYGWVNGSWVQLFTGAGLSRAPVVHAQWDQIAVGGIRAVVRESRIEGQVSRRAQFDEIYFPGYRAVVGVAAERPSLLPLQVEAVGADSTMIDQWAAWEPEYIFDHDMGTENGYSAWQSMHRPGAHYVQFRFARPYLLDNVQVVNALQSQLVNAYAPRIDAMEVWLLEQGGWQEVWARNELRDETVIEAKWRAVMASAGAIVIRRSLAGGAPVDYALIQEVVFPGYFAVFDWSASSSETLLKTVEAKGTRAGERVQQRAVWARATRD
ncbi:MAG TPA: hypothetical protein VK066_30875 [Chloroflexota bacterium]|nr:hypothetical protein [Chloroflexota bacterium]